jgi:ankyrin repeat protein
MVKYLVGEKNANISNDSLQTAIKRGYLDIVKYLVEKGEKVDYYDITTATHHDRRDIVDYLNSVINKN